MSCDVVVVPRKKREINNKILGAKETRAELLFSINPWICPFLANYHHLFDIYPLLYRVGSNGLRCALASLNLTDGQISSLFPVPGNPRLSFTNGSKQDEISTRIVALAYVTFQTETRGPNAIWWWHWHPLYWPKRSSPMRLSSIWGF